jgi:TolA-binding protein
MWRLRWWLRPDAEPHETAVFFGCGAVFPGEGEPATKHFNLFAAASIPLHSVHMVRLIRPFLILLALVFGVVPAFAVSQAETNAFAIAMDKFEHLPPDLAEKDFADFVRKYPNSTRVPEAILREAQGMLSSGQVNGAIDLLTTNRADTLAPQYLYWLGRARFQNNDFAGAANTFAEMLQKYRGAREALEATIREGDAFAHLGQWPRVEQLLTETNGLFREGKPSEMMASGYLLLGEAQFAQGKFAAVQSTLHLLEAQPMGTQLKWQRDYLASRVQRAEGRLEESLQSAESLLATQDRTNRAEGVTFVAGVLEQMGKLEDAAAIYTNNLALETPPEQQRRAILKIAELDLKQNRLVPAVQSLTNYLSQIPPPEGTDLALLTLGEVRMKQALFGSDTNLTGGETNLFQNALTQFQRLTNSFPNSPYLGKSLLDQGWCLWNQGKILESQAAFRSAAEHLPFSEEQAEARFKWADTQFVMGDYAAAVTNYNSIAEKYASLPEAKEHNFIERALYQSGRAALNQNDIVAAASALKNILAWYPNGFAGPSLLLLTGQGLTEQKDAAGARKLFAEFEQLYPTNALLSEVELAIARSYEAEGNWNAAITNYSAWKERFPNHHLQPQAEFNLARDNYMAGRETNALVLFTNFITHFPKNELAARAQFWVGDFYLRQGDSKDAEFNYQLVFLNTNWPASELTYEARMMAGHAAMVVFNYKDAISYFTNLLVPSCPLDLQVQAAFAFADATISQDPTNTADLRYAFDSLQTIVQTRSNRWEAAQAWGRIGDCYFNMGARDPDQYAFAISNYTKAIEAPAALNETRNQARFKLAATKEKQAMLKTGAEQTSLLKEALTQYSDAFYQNLHEPEGPSTYWINRSGFAAAQVAESLQRWDDAANIYINLKTLLPVLAPICDKKISKANEHRPNTALLPPPITIPPLSNSSTVLK